MGAEREAEYMAALDEIAENAFDDQVRRARVHPVGGGGCLPAPSVPPPSCAPPRALPACPHHPSSPTHAQCTGANPRYPTIADLKQILTDAWEAPILPLASLEFPAPPRAAGAKAGNGAAPSTPAAGFTLNSAFDTDRT